MNAADAGKGGFRLQPAGTAYAKQLAALHAQCFSKGWSSLEFESFFERAGVFAALAYHNAAQEAQPSLEQGLLRSDSTSRAGATQRAAGFILCWIIEDVCDLLSIGVIPEFRREGVGQMLLDYATDTARDMGASSIVLEVNINNVAAHAIYEANGYAKDGIRKAYYSNPDGTRADAVIFRKRL